MQLDDINIFDSKPPTPEEILAAGPGSTVRPLDPFERMSAFDRLSTDPVKRKLQKVGRGLGSLFAVETPLDAVLSGVAAAKPVVAAGKGLVTLAHGTTKDAAKQIQKEGAITPKLGSYVEDMYIKRGDYKDVDPFDYPPQASYFSTADNPASSISAMEAQIGYKLGKNIDEPISLKEIEDHGAIVLSDANPKYVFKMDEDDFMPYDLLGNRQSIDAPMGFEANDIVSFLPQEPKKILQGKQLVNFVKKNRGEDRGIAALTRPVFPAPQRMFDSANKGYNPSLSDFSYEPGGRYLQMGKDKTDITGQIPQAGRISVGPDGKPSFMVSADLAESLPDTGKIIRTNLFKKKAGWKWTKTPEGFDPNPASDFPIVSVETGNKHYYTLATDFPDGVELSRYAKKTSEPRLRPTTKGEINLGQKVGEISVRGKKHPVYDQITAGQVKGIASL